MGWQKEKKSIKKHTKQKKEITMQKIKTLLCLVICFFIYQIPNRIQIFSALTWPECALDQHIQFWSWTYPIYFSYFFELPLLVLAINNDDQQRVRKFIFRMITLQAVFFLVFPTTIDRPHSEWLGLLTLIDEPFNCFPSLHVSLSLFLTLLNRKHIWAIVWCSLICLSTLTTKQHYVLDMIGGATVASITFYLWNRSK